MCSRVKYFCWFYSSPKKLLEIKTLSISAGSFTALVAISETTAVSKCSCSSGALLLITYSGSNIMPIHGKVVMKLQRFRKKRYTKFYMLKLC